MAENACSTFTTTIFRPTYTDKNACATDVLLKDVGQALSIFTSHLRPFLRGLKTKIPAGELLLFLQWRSKDVFQEFADFYCLRLLLDEQSSLATYFIDLFFQLEWLLEDLVNHPIHRQLDESLLVNHPIHHQLDESLYALRSIVRRVSSTCRFLYALCRMSPRHRGSGPRENEEFKRVGRQGRRFSWNEFHCRVRQLGLVNLDQPGTPMVRLMEELGNGISAKVYKGFFEAGHGSDEHGRMIIGDPVAVKMYANDRYGSSGCGFGSQFLQSMEKMTSQHISADHQQRVPHDHGGVVKDDRLRVELGRLISVRHPNIVIPKGYICKRPQGECGLVMELMDETLHDYLGEVQSGSVPPLTELDMLDLMLEIAKGMRFLHECNLMHRDLKPRNVLLRFHADEDLGRKFMEVKLADFGLMKLYALAQDGMMHTTFVGTSCYMAPEVRGGNAEQGLAYQEKIDVFSYGTTCFNILIGNPDPCAFSYKVEPFYEAVRTGRWKQWVKGIDKNLGFLVKLIARCWEMDPGMRPTFAMICTLLQHAMQCLVSSHYLVHSFRSTYASKLHRYVKGTKVQYSRRCASVIMKFVGSNTTIVGLEMMTRCLEELESAMVDQPRVPSVDEDVSDMAQDIYNFLKARRNGHFKGLASAYKRQLSAPVSLNKLMESSLNTTDPLIFIKWLATHTLCNQFNSVDEDVERLYAEGKLSLTSVCKRPEFNFKDDEAYCDLHIDTSLIPLLVSFGTFYQWF